MDAIRYCFENPQQMVFFRPWAIWDEQIDTKMEKIINVLYIAKALVPLFPIITWKAVLAVQGTICPHSANEPSFSVISNFPQSFSRFHCFGVGRQKTPTNHLLKWSTNIIVDIHAWAHPMFSKDCLQNFVTFCDHKEQDFTQRKASR